MNDERIEGALQALHDRLVAGDKIKDVNTPIPHASRVMRDTVREPVAACFDEFGLMKSRALLAPAGTFADRRDAIDQMLRRIMLVADPNRYWPYARAMLIGRGRPSRPSRSQSQSLKVKMKGVALISSTMVSAPEQCSVPAGIRK